MERVADDLWTETAPLRFLGIETGTRTNLVRLRDGRVFVHSPGRLTPEVRRFVAGLGPVAAIAAPSLFHHLWAGDWKAAHPDARLYACPGLARKRPDLAWDGVLSDAPEPEWAEDLDQVHFGARTLESEVVFFHRASRTLLCCDAVFNLATHPSRLTRLAAALLGQRAPGATWLERLMIRDRAAARAQVERMLAWDVQHILLAHGAPIDADGREVLRRAYAWL